MKKVLIASATVFAIVASAGMSMAGPLRDQGQRGFGQKVHASASQAIGHASQKSQGPPDHLYDRLWHPFDVKIQSGPKEPVLGTADWRIWRERGLAGPNVVVIPIQQDGSYTLVIGKSSGSDLTPYPRLNYYW